MSKKIILSSVIISLLILGVGASTSLFKGAHSTEKISLSPTKGSSSERQYFLTKEECESVTKTLCELTELPKGASLSHGVNGGESGIIPGKVQNTWTPIVRTPVSQSTASGIGSTTKKTGIGSEREIKTTDKQGSTQETNNPSGGTNIGQGSGAWGGGGTTSTPTVPDVPVVLLEYKGRVFNGPLGAGCWITADSQGSINPVCWNIPLPNPTALISLPSGEFLVARITAYKAPKKVTATFFDATTKEERITQELSVSLNPELYVTVKGNYIILIRGEWEEGNVSYAFKVDVK